MKLKAIILLMTILTVKVMTKSLNKAVYKLNNKNYE